MNLPRLIASALPVLALGTLTFDATAQESKPATVTSKFRWPAPGKVTVTEEVLKKGKTMQMRYTARTRRPKESENMLVSLENFKFLKFNGRDATDPKMQAALGPALSLTTAIPDLVVNKAGEYVRTTGMDEVMKRVTAMMANHKGTAPAELKALQQTMQRPAFRQAMEASAGAFWNTWVGNWSGWEIPSGREAESKTFIPLGEIKMPAKVTVTNHGPVQGKPGFVRLSTKTVATGPEACKAYAQFMRKMLGDAIAKSGKPFTDDMIAKIRFEYDGEVVTRLEDLRPIRALHEKRVTIAMKGGQPRKQLERRSYAFDWK